MNHATKSSGSMDVKLHVSFTSAPTVPAPPSSRKQPVYFYSLDTKLSGTLKSLPCKVLSLQELHRGLPGRNESLFAGRGVVIKSVYDTAEPHRNPHFHNRNGENIRVCVCVAHVTAICRKPPTYSLTGERQNLTDPKHTNT
jgi:hypothetical protein